MKGVPIEIPTEMDDRGWFLCPNVSHHPKSPTDMAVLVFHQSPKSWHINPKPWMIFIGESLAKMDDWGASSTEKTSE